MVQQIFPVLRTLSARVILGCLASTPALAEAGAPSKTGASAFEQDSIRVLPATTIGKRDWAGMAKLDLRLGTSPAVKSPAQIAFEIIVWNTGPAPFWIPHTLAMPSGALEVLWSFNNETTQTRPVSPSCGDWTLEYVHVPAASCYGRRVDLAPMDGRSIRIDGPTGNDPWPPGHYEFRVRMSLADGDAEAGVPGGVFESEPVHVEVTK